MFCSSLAAQWFSATGQIAIGLCVIYVAWQQHRTAKNKLRLDLYERRFELYQAVDNALATLEVGTIHSGEAIGQHRREMPRIIREAKFLFDSDTNLINALVTIEERVRDLHAMQNTMLQGAHETAADYRAWAKEMRESEHLMRLFRKYLSFGRI